MPRLTVVLGVSGSGKSTWCRLNRHLLQDPFYDADAIAAQLGDPNDKRNRDKAQKQVNAAINKHIANRESFGFESVYGGPTRAKDVLRAFEAGYEIDALFLGTTGSNQNIARVRQRVAEGGHNVSSRVIQRHWKDSPNNLIDTWHAFRSVKILDTTSHEPVLVAIKEGEATKLHVPKAEVPRWAIPVLIHAGVPLTADPNPKS